MEARPEVPHRRAVTHPWRRKTKLPPSTTSVRRSTAELRRPASAETEAPMRHNDSERGRTKESERPLFRKKEKSKKSITAGRTMEWKRQALFFTQRSSKNERPNY